MINNLLIINIILYVFLFDRENHLRTITRAFQSRIFIHMDKSIASKYRFNIIINSTYEDDIQLISLRYMYLYMSTFKANVQFSVTGSIAVT